MPPFEVHSPTSAAQAATLYERLDEAMYIAGGTDLLVNLKHGLHRPSHLISLSGIAELKEISQEPDGTLRIGAGNSLHRVANNPLVVEGAPGLARAASVVAGPQHRRMGTIGGNVMLDTRCLFYNQSASWRNAIGYCLKRDGDWCHVIGSAKACVAAQSSDTVPMLIALGAQLVVHAQEGPQILELESLFTKDGRLERVHAVKPGALVTEIRIPPRAAGHRSTYRKVRQRDSIDYPMLGVAVSAAFDGSALTHLSIVLGAMLPRPRRLGKLDGFLGAPLTDQAIEQIAERAYKAARPVANIAAAPEWRREMARVELDQALRDVRGR
jgi:4-hydroxybenzoyl-CoA reductase subunit beta